MATVVWEIVESVVYGEASGQLSEHRLLEDFYRARVIDGWLVDRDGSVTFVPDPEREWN